MLSLFSVVSASQDQLNPLQRIPHIDGSNPNDIAFLHYLCDEKYSGTGIYRNKSTGHEYVGQQRFATHIETLNRDINPPIDRLMVTSFLFSAMM